MAHDPKDHSHAEHDHDHNHHHHPHDGDHHHWDSQSYVADWIRRDLSRQGERRPFLDRLVGAVPFARDAAIDVLDVGGGSGIVTDTVLATFPRAKVTLQDYSEPMIERARTNFAARGAQVRYVLYDLRDAAWETAVGGPFDLAVSGIAIHNLNDMAAIATCYQAVRRLLKSGGCFLDYDHFDRIGGVPLHQYTLKVAGFASVETVWQQFPSAVVKALA
jgi:ubiquinone/menaquinone biosynthesis C-methylase UbiE